MRRVACVASFVSVVLSCILSSVIEVIRSIFVLMVKKEE